MHIRSGTVFADVYQESTLPSEVSILTRGLTGLRKKKIAQLHSLVVHLPAGPNRRYMTGLSIILEQLGLTQYLQAFLDEGFDSWVTLMDITEADLAALHVKLGHRRKLQRAIIEARGKTRDNIVLGAPQHLGPRAESYRSDEDGVMSARDQEKQVSLVNGNVGGQKRKYRRHPKPDEYAPERPPSAYVIFSNQMRDQMKGQDLSFTEIAKIVGERWQMLAAHEKEPCERQAQALKENYYISLNEYKKTPHYAQYQEYLAEFKAKHSQQPENKRHRSEQGGQNRTRNSSEDGTARIQQSPSSSGNPNEPSTFDWHGSVSPTNNKRLHVSSLKADAKPPVETSSPVSAFRHFPLEPASDESALSVDLRRQPLPLHTLPGQLYNGQRIRHVSPSRDPKSPSTIYTRPSAYDRSHSPSRRKVSGEEGPQSLPTGDGGSTGREGAKLWNGQTYQLPAINGSKSSNNRILPPPLPQLGVMSELMKNRRPVTNSSSTFHPSNQNEPHVSDGSDVHSRLSIATLLRAGEQLDQGVAHNSSDNKGKDRLWERK